MIKMNSLWDLFQSCDADESGFIGLQEVRTICNKFGITAEDADNIFLDLDRDGDGQISFEDFREGFKDYENHVLADESSLMKNKPSNETSENKASSEGFSMDAKQYLTINKVKQASNLKRVRSFTRRIDKALADETLDPEKQSQMIEELMDNLQKLKAENETLAKSFMRERREHEEHLQQIELDIDSQVRQVEERYKERAKQEIEAERRSLRELMKEEMDQLQAQLSMFDKVESWLKNNQSMMENEKMGEFRSKLEEALQENRQMRLSLLDTQTTVAMMRNELSQLKTMYEQKCHELTAERERVLEVVNNQDFMARQLMLLQNEVTDRFQGVEQQPTQIFTTSTLAEEKYRSNQEKTKKGSIIGDYLKVLPTHRNRSESISEQENDCNNNQNGGVLLTIPDCKSEASSDCGYASRKNGDDNDQSSIMTRDDREYESNYSSNISDGNNNSSDDSHSLGQEKAQIDWFAGIEDLSGPGESWFNLCLLEKAKTLDLIFIGDMSVGKSALIYKLVKNKFLNNLCSTVGVDFHIKTLSVDGKPISVQLWDTGGQERFRSITISYFRKADGVLIMYDVTSQRSFINVRSWMAHLSEYNEHIPCVLVGNKIDLRNESGSAISRENGEKLAKEFGCPFFEISVKDGINVQQSFGAIIRKMLESERVKYTSNNIELEKPIDTKKKKCCSDK